MGRWLAQSGYGSEPADWTREVAAAYVAAVDRATIGQWSTVAGAQRLQAGQPFKPATKAGALTALRRFFRDCQEWGWIPTRFNPYQALATPRSVRCLIGPDPHIIQDDIWAKLLWAGLNLTDQDLSKPNDSGEHVVMGTSTRRPWSKLWRLCGCSQAFAATRSPGSASAAYAGRTAKRSRAASRYASCTSPSTRPERHSPSLWTA